MSSEPFILKILQAVLAIPALAIRLTALPLHAHLSFTTRVVVDAPTTLASGVGRWLSSTVTIALIMGYVYAGPLIFSEFIIEPGAVQLILAALASAFITALGIAFNELGTLLSGEWTLPLHLYLYAAVVDAQIDLIVAILGTVVCSLLVRIVPLCRTVGSDSSSWRMAVVYNLGMSVVDWLCIPLVVLLVVCFWRFESAWAAIRAHDSESTQRLELLKQSCAAVGDVPVAIVRVAFYAFVSVVALFLLVSWRMPSLVATLRAIAPEERTPQRLSRAVVHEFIKLVVDLPAIVATLFVGVISLLIGAVGRALCLPVMSAWPPYRLKPIVEAISSQAPSTAPASAPATGSTLLRSWPWSEPPAAATRVDEPPEALWSWTAIRATWHYMAMTQLGLMLIDVPFGVLGLIIVLTGWRAPNVLEPLRRTERGPLLDGNVPPNVLDECELRSHIAREFGAWCVDVPFLVLPLVVTALLAPWRIPSVCRAASLPDDAMRRHDVRVEALQAGHDLLLVGAWGAVLAAEGSLLLIWIDERSLLVALPVALLAAYVMRALVGALECISVAASAEVRASNGYDDGFERMYAQAVGSLRRGLLWEQLVNALADVPAIALATPVVLTAWRAREMLAPLVRHHCERATHFDVPNEEPRRCWHAGEVVEVEHMGLPLKRRQRGAILPAAYLFHAMMTFGSWLIDVPYLLAFVVVVFMPWRTQSIVRVACGEPDATARRALVCHELGELILDLATFLPWVAALAAASGPLVWIAQGGLDGSPTSPVFGALAVLPILNWLQRMALACSDASRVAMAKTDSTAGFMPSLRGFVPWLHGNQGFVPAESFDGARPGFVYKHGPAGPGYYPETFDSGASLKRMVARQQLVLFLLDIPYLLATVTVVLTRSVSRHMHERRLHAQVRHPFAAYEAGIDLSNRLADHRIVLSCGLTALIDLPFLVMAALAMLFAPWRGAAVARDVFCFQLPDGAATDDVIGLRIRVDAYWRRRSNATRHLVTAPLDWLVICAAPLVTVAVPWRVAAVRDGLRAAVQRPYLEAVETSAPVTKAGPSDDTLYVRFEDEPITLAPDADHLLPHTLVLGAFIAGLLDWLFVVCVVVSSPLTLWRLPWLLGSFMTHGRHHGTRFASLGMTLGLCVYDLVAAIAMTLIVLTTWRVGSLRAQWSAPVLEHVETNESGDAVAERKHADEASRGDGTMPAQDRESEVNDEVAGCHSEDLRRHHLIFSEFGMLLLELIPFALVNALITLTLWRAYPLHRRLLEAGSDNGGRRSILVEEGIRWVVDPLAAAAVLFVMLTWRGPHLGHKLWRGETHWHVVAFEQLRAVGVDLPSVVCLLLLLLMPWRLYLCIRDILGSSMVVDGDLSRTRRRASAWHLAFGFLDIVTLIVAAVPILTCYRLSRCGRRLRAGRDIESAFPLEIDLFCRPSLLFNLEAGAFAHLVVLDEALQVVLDAPFLVLGAAVMLSGWRTTHLHNELQNHPPLTSAWRFEFGHQFVLLLADVPFITLAGCVCLSLYRTTSMLSALQRAWLDPSERRRVILVEACELMQDLPCLLLYPSLIALSFTMLSSGWHLGMWHLSSISAALATALISWRAVPLLWECLMVCTLAKDRRGAVARCGLLTVLDWLLLPAVVCLTATVWRLPRLVHAVLITRSSWLHVTQPLDARNYAADGSPQRATSPSIPVIDGDLAIGLTGEEAHEFATLRGLGLDAQPSDAKSAESSVLLSWHACTRIHVTVAAQALELCIDMPFAICAVLTSCGLYRIPWLWPSLLYDWPFSRGQMEEISYATLSWQRQWNTCIQRSRRPDRYDQLGDTSHEAEDGDELHEPFQLLTLPDDCLLLIAEQMVASSDWLGLTRLDESCGAIHSMLMPSAHGDRLWGQMLHNCFPSPDDETCLPNSALLPSPAPADATPPAAANPRRAPQSWFDHLINAFVSAGKRTVHHVVAKLQYVPAKQRFIRRLRLERMRVSSLGPLQQSDEELERLAMWSTVHEFETKRQAAYRHFLNTLFDVPFLLIGMPLLVTWRAPMLVADFIQAFRLTRRGRPVQACNCFKSRSRRPFEAWRMMAAEHFIAILLECICVPLIFAIVVARWLLDMFGLRALVQTMDPDFDQSFQMATQEAQAVGSDRRMRDAAFQADGWIARTPLLRLTRCGLVPHVWAIRQIAVVLFHLPFLFIGGCLLLTPRHSSLVDGLTMCGGRGEMRQLVLLNLAWLIVDVLALPLVAVVMLGLWRIPTFVSLLEQRAFQRDHGWRFFAAALVSVVLMLHDLLLLVLVLLILITGVRAPHLCSAGSTLSALYRQLWSEPRWQMEDGHVAQLLQLALSEMERQRAQARARGGSPPVAESDLTEWAADGLTHFLRADASSQTGGGLVYVSRGRVRSVPRSLSLFSGLILSEAKLVAMALPQLLLLPIKVVSAFVAVPIVMYLRWRLRASSLDAADEQAIVHEAWSAMQRARVGHHSSAEPPMELGVAALQLVRAEHKLRTSLTAGPLATLLLRIAFEWTPLSLDPSELEKYFAPAMLGLLLIVLNDIAAVVAVPLRVISALLTFGFGCLWGREPETYFRPVRGFCYRCTCTLSRMLQYLCSPVIILLQIALLLVPPLLCWPSTRAWVLQKHNEGVVIDGDLAVHELLPLLAGLPWYAHVLNTVWAFEWTLSLMLLRRVAASNVLWQLPPYPHTMGDPDAPVEGFSCRRLIPSTLIYYSEKYMHLIGWATQYCYRFGGLGEMPLLVLVIVWAGWPLLPPYLATAPGWYLLAAPASLFLLFLANGQISVNWRAEPQVVADSRALVQRTERDKQERWQSYLRLRAHHHQEELTTLCDRLRALAPREDTTGGDGAPRVRAIDPFMEDDGTLLHRAVAGGGDRAPPSVVAAMGPRARVRWSREHLGAERDGKRVDSIWNAVWVPLTDDVGALLEVALVKGHAACALDAEHYVDLAALWNPLFARPVRVAGDDEADDGDELAFMREVEAEAELPMSWWLRRNPPPIAYFGVRRLDEADTYWASARPRRFVQRSIVGGARPFTVGSNAEGGAYSSSDEHGVMGQQPSNPIRTWFGGLAAWGARSRAAGETESET